MFAFLKSCPLDSLSFVFSLLYPLYFVLNMICCIDCIVHRDPVPCSNTTTNCTLVYLEMDNPSANAFYDEWKATPVVFSSEFFFSSLALQLTDIDLFLLFVADANLS